MKLEIKGSFDLELERITRESEAKLRAENIKEMMDKPFETKVRQSCNKVNEFVDILSLPKVYVSTSGGKDSAAVVNLCQKMYPDIKLIMFDTGLEYQATKDLAREQGAEIIPPKTNWKKFCEEKGYPAVSKQVSKRIHDAKVSPVGAAITMFSRVYHLSHKWLHFLECDIPISQKCCDEFKKKPAHSIKLNPILGTRIQESSLRKNAWKKTGCNSYNLNYTSGISRPISLWTDENVETYIVENDVPLSEVYTQYQEKRTGCVCCPYGAHMDGSRFELLKKLEPARYEYFIHKTKLGTILALSGVHIDSDEKYMEKVYHYEPYIKVWHKEAMGDNNYLSFKVKWLLERYSYQQIKDSIDHLNSQRENNLFYPYEEIMKELNKQAGRGLKHD